MTPDDKKQQKKPYRSPVIEVYGDIRTITKAVGMTGAGDGGSGNMQKTAL